MMVVRPDAAPIITSDFGPANIDFGGRTVRARVASVDVRASRDRSSHYRQYRADAAGRRAVPARRCRQVLQSGSCRPRTRGRDDKTDIIFGILHHAEAQRTDGRGEPLRAQIAEIIRRRMPPAVKVRTIFTRSRRPCAVTVRTVLHNLAFGIALIFLDPMGSVSRQPAAAR